eukprot:COSAG03_NODE_107_length_12621_cov_360.337087_4_plen_120_part_00
MSAPPLITLNTMQLSNRCTPSSWVVQGWFNRLFFSPGEHVANVDGNAALGGRHGRPALRFCQISGVGGALEPGLAHALKQQRDAVPVGVRAGPPVRGASPILPRATYTIISYKTMMRVF